MQTKSFNPGAYRWIVAGCCLFSPFVCSINAQNPVENANA